jgi:hypothetical protein
MDAEAAGRLRCLWIVWMSILVSTNGRGGVRWWLIVTIIVVAVTRQHGGYLWDRKRGT